MAVQYILSTDRLQSGFRAKYNLTAAEIITGFTDNGDGTISVAKFGGATFTIDATDSFFTKAEITALFADVAPSKSPIEYEYNQSFLVDQGGGNWYLPYLTPVGGAVPDGVMPYNIITVYEDPDNPGEFVTKPVPAFYEDSTLWDEPRIYGFPDPATDQTITIFAI